jgi:phage terminase small subunit
MPRKSIHEPEQGASTKREKHSNRTRITLRASGFLFKSVYLIKLNQAMNPHLKDNERELVKLVNHFKKRSEKLIDEGKLGEEHRQVGEACERLVTKLDQHAQGRTRILEQREALKHLVKDNAVCPKCNTMGHLKHMGEVTHEKGWKNNRYRCRRCNIEFTWNRPNNPWDMILFMEHVIRELETGLEQMNPETAEETKDLIAQMQDGLSKLRPVIENSDAEYEEFKARDIEMAKLINEFKSYLLIEKIKMDSWNQEIGQG